MKYRNREGIEAEQWLPSPEEPSYHGIYQIEIDGNWKHIRRGDYVVNGKSIMSKEYFEQTYELA